MNKRNRINLKAGCGILKQRRGAVHCLSFFLETPCTQAWVTKGCPSSPAEMGTLAMDLVGILRCVHRYFRLVVLLASERYSKRLTHHQVSMYLLI